jgi:hypothetical protein
VGARSFALALLVAVGFLAGGAAVASAAQLTTPSNQLQVWNVNTAGMHTGNGSPATDYRKFVAFITDPARVTYMPDIVTIQEAGVVAKGEASCTAYAGALQTATNHSYYCVETTRTGGAAVVFRNDRLVRETVSAPAGTDIRNGKWVQEKERTQAGGTCQVGNWYAMAVRLKDSQSLKHVNVASFHLPTGANTDADCAWENMQTLDNELGAAAPSADMRVMAGDANHSDATTDSTNNTFFDWEYWYKHTNINTAPSSPCGAPDLCWKDVIYRKWLNAGPTLTFPQIYGYMHAYEWTYVQTGTYAAPTKTDRRDYIFAKAFSFAFDAPNQPQTVRWEDAGGTAVPYSDHRGLGALMTYY